MNTPAASKLKQQRDILVARIYEMEARLYVPDEQLPPVEEAARIREQMYSALEEYSDILPRLALSACPFCGEALKRVIDPFGLDGPWWHVDVQVKYQEPSACDHFRVLLGALSLGERIPSEVVAEVRPGPDVPFVVPALLTLPGMRAVMASIELAAGDIGYPIGYFSNKPTRPMDLHQSWCRDAYWFRDEKGHSAFSIANDVFDFELAQYVKDGRLSWVDLERIEGWSFEDSRAAFPFFGIPGDRERQQLIGGERSLLGLPTGEVLNPFDS